MLSIATDDVLPEFNEFYFNCINVGPKKLFLFKDLTLYYRQLNHIMVNLFVIKIFLRQTLL